MNTQINDGGPAFPTRSIVGHSKRSDMRYSENCPGDPIFGDVGGMSLRDWFAGQAMQAMMTQDAAAQNWTDVKVAQWSYATADAMLAEREKKGGS